MSVELADLALSLRRDQVLADDGLLYDTVQAAENAAGSFIWVPPATFNESVLVNTSGLRILGSGKDSLIDGTNGGDDAIRVTASDVLVSNMSYQSNATNSRGLHGESGSDGLSISQTRCLATDSAEGMRFEDTDVVVSRYTAGSNIGRNAMTTVARRTNVSLSRHQQAEAPILIGGKDGVVSNTVVDSPSGTGGDGRGLDANANDCVFIGCRVISAPEIGIIVRSGVTDNIIANNRVSDSGTSDITDNGTDTLLDGNRTGASN